MLDLARIHTIELHDAVIAAVSLLLPTARIEFAHIAAYVPTADPAVDDVWKCRAVLLAEDVRTFEFDGQWKPNLWVADDDVFVAGREAKPVTLLSRARDVHLTMTCSGQILSKLTVTAGSAHLELEPLRVFEQRRR